MEIDGKPRPNQGHARVDLDGAVMATLTVVKFSSAGGADDALDTLNRLQSQELIRVHDAAVVSWPSDRKKPVTHELHDTKKAGALGGAFWGFLFGLIFLVPFLGAAIGAGAGALMGSLRDVGISDAFIKDVREKITPGTSALFVLTSDAVLDRVAAEFRGSTGEIIHTNLSQEEEAQLHAAFDQD
jgi:uncharacterized membrane protein